MCAVAAALDTGGVAGQDFKRIRAVDASREVIQIMHRDRVSSDNKNKTVLFLAGA